MEREQRRGKERSNFGVNKAPPPISMEGLVPAREVWVWSNSSEKKTHGEGGE